MWQKLKEKRAVEREYEGNFKAGRIDIQERNLHRTGIRGRKRYIYYAFLYLLGILCFVNLVMLCIMLSVLRIRVDKTGMESLSLFKSGLVRWMYGGDLQHVVLKTGEIGSFDGYNLTMVGNNAGVNFAHYDPGVNSSVAHFGPNHTLLQTKNGVRIVSTDINKTILHIAKREIVWDVPAQVTDLDTTYVISHRITSDHTEDLRIEGKKVVTITGNENVFLDSKYSDFKTITKGSISMATGNDSTMSFETPKVYFKRIPEIDNVTKVSAEKMYRLCICKNNMKLFKIEVKLDRGCQNAISACSA